MRRRRHDTPDDNPLPAHLRAFNPDDWPGPTDWRRYNAWSTAVDTYAEQHPDQDTYPWVTVPADVAWNPKLDPL